jgi:hypothetical protein
MIQQYLAGELSVLLAPLQAVTRPELTAGDVARLRRQAETFPTNALAGVAVRALEFVEALCWDSLTMGDVASFNRLASVGGRLREFVMCAGLVDER